MNKPEDKQPEDTQVDNNTVATDHTQSSESTPDTQIKSETTNESKSQQTTEKQETKADIKPKQTPSEERKSSEAKTSTEQKIYPTTSPSPVVIQQSSGKGLAVGAIILAILGLGASGFLFVQGQNTLKNQQLDFEQKIEKAALGESQNANLLQDNLRKQAELDSALSQLNRVQKDNSDKIALTNQAYQALLKSRSNWIVDETEAMLNLASQQLFLFGNVPVVINLLESMNTRLAQFDQPELLPIKQAISSDLAALKNHPYLDTTSASLRIDRLETAIAGLPLAADSILQSSNTTNNSLAPDTNNLPWWKATWKKVTTSLEGAVEVRRLDNGDVMLMAPDQIYFVKENIRLRLIDARLALLQHNAEIYQSDLNSAESAVKQYFDNRSPATQTWLKELSDLKSLDIRIVGDDSLKASLTAVRTYQEDAKINPTPSVLPEASTASQPEASTNTTESNSASAPAVIPPSPNHDEVKPTAPAEKASSQETKPETVKPKAHDVKPDTVKPKSQPQNTKPAIKKETPKSPSKTNESKGAKA